MSSIELKELVSKIDGEVEPLFKEAAESGSFVEFSDIRAIAEDIFGFPEDHEIFNRSVNKFLEKYSGERVRNPETNEILGYRFG